MTKFKNKYRVESTRLPGWDYSQPGWYFVTICTRDRLCFFGDVVDGAMRLSPIGEIVAEEWRKTPQIRPNVELDEWIVMPNHVHGIIVITVTAVVVETPRRGVSTTMGGLTAGSLGAIVGQIKSVCTKRIWAAGYTDFGWQSQFYDRIIRDELTLERVREYIRNNPLKWERDRNNPANVFM
jgi:putative transposase